MEEPVTVHAGISIPWQRRYLAAFLAGLENIGVSAKHSEGQDDGPGTHIIFGPNLFRPLVSKLSDTGRDFLTVNRAFIGSVLGDEANPYVAIGWNGYNNLARFPFELGEKLPHSRLGSLYRYVKSYQRRRQEGNTPIALVLGEYETPQDYLDTVRSELDDAGELSFFRPHPAATAPKDVRLAPWSTIEDAIDNSAYALTHHSTAGVTALIRGCPVVTYNQESMAYPITSHSLDELRYPDRRPWLEWLAWTQWTIEEIARGDPWEYFV